jgi:hypothetical protein
VEVAGQFGLSRNEANMVSIVNGALGEAAFGTRERMSWFVDHAMAQGWTGWSAIRVLEAVAILRRMEGDWRGLDEALSEARSLVRPSFGEAQRNDMELYLALVEAQSWLDRELPERATLIIDSVRTFANSSDIDQLVDVETLALASASARVVYARQKGDIDAAAEAVAEAERLAGTCRELEAAAARGDSAPISWFARGRLLLVDGELQRARGQADATTWRVAAEKAERVGHRSTATYARMRCVETLVDAGAATAEVTEALDAADAAAAERGDATILAKLAALRARAEGPPGARPHAD